MDTNKSSLKNNLIKLVLFFSASLLSILLIMMAVNMFNLSTSGDAGGVENKNVSYNDNVENNEDTEKQHLEYSGDKEKQEESEDINDIWEDRLGNEDGSIEEQFDDWKEQARERKDNAFNPSLEEEHYAQGGQNKSFMPDAGGFNDDFFNDIPNIDISGKKHGTGGSLGGGGSTGNSIVTNEEKKEHIPVFEVLGEPNYPFLKVMVMENYHKNRWLVDTKEEPELKLMIGVEVEERFTENSVKIKPIKPSSGNLPVLSGNFELKYHHALLKYENTSIYVAENPVESFYEMVYSTPPTQERLKNARVDKSDYELSYSKELEALINTIIENSNSDYEAIKFVEEYLLENYVLDNLVINDYGDEDGIQAFLFGGERIGNSLDFLSAYTFILRAIGIPCRLAVGYRIDETKPYQIVYGDQRYIYPEIKFEKYGWIPMDVFPSYPFYTPPETTRTEIIHADSMAKRGTSFNVRGTVRDSNGRLLDGLEVLIYLKEDKNAPYLSYAKANVKNGYFEVECNVKDQTGPGNYNVIAELLENDLYRTSSSDPELKVVTDTNLELDSNNTIIGTSFKIEGRIIDAFSEEGLKEFPINIKFEGIDIFEEVYSKDEGHFTKNIKIDIPENLSPIKKMAFAKKYSLHYQVSFNGTEFYYPSSVDANLYVWKLMPLRIIMGMILFLLSVAFFVFLLKKTKKTLPLKEVQLALEGVEDTFLTPSNNNFIVNRKREGQKLFIEFPFIKEKFPNVWGVGDDFLIRFIDDKGNFCEKQVVFHKKGKYIIKVLEKSIPQVSRQLNIVIYREEIISIGKKFLKDVLGEDIEISATMTLREIYLSLESKVLEKKYKILEKIFVILEKAVYSLDVIDRNDYEMFLIVIEKYKMS
jgi:hypothetical protein